MLIYAFAVLFSSMPHQHNHNLFDDDISSADKEIHHSKYKDYTSDKDCASCHFVSQNHSLQLSSFDFEVFIQDNEQNIEQNYLLQNYSSQKLLSKLRGPPYAFQ